MSTRPARRVLLIGWDAADWRVIDPLLDAGRMPALESVVDQGVIGNLATLRPVLSPMLWTSIATGMRAYKHGIHGFTEPRPDGKGVTPVTNLSRKVKAVWNILQQNGLRSNVVGWWPSHPVEPIDGVMVSDHFQQAVGPLDEAWPMRPETVHPERLADTLAELRVHPFEIEADHLLPFVPRAAEAYERGDRRLLAIAKTLAECTSIHAAATWIMENEPWDFMAVYFDAIDHFSHGFMKYHPPRQPHVSEEDFDLYHGVVDMAYWYHSVMLGRLLELAGKDTTVIIVSDHGFHCDQLRPRQLPNEPAGPAEEHRMLGVFAMSGPGIKQDERIHGANLLDITPTILSLFGLPVGEDMDGKPLLDAFESPPAVETIPSWQEVDGNTGEHPPGKQLDAVESEEALQQLVALGYVEAPDQDHAIAMRQTQQELDYNLARAYMDGERHGDAIPILERLLVAAPLQYRFGLHLALCYQALRRVAEMRTLVERLIALRQEAADRARRQLRRYQDEGKRRTLAQDEDDGDPTPVFQASEQQTIQRLTSESQIRIFPLDYLMGHVCLMEGNADEALLYFAKAERADPRRPGLHIQIGEAHLALERWDAAERNFRRALEIENENAAAHVGLCRSLLRQGRVDRAAEHARTATGLLYHYPAAHYFLGVARRQQGRLEEAQAALERALTLNPNFKQAHQQLASLYDEEFANSLKAAEHREWIVEIEKIESHRAGQIGGFDAIRPAIERTLADEIERSEAEASPRSLEQVAPNVGQDGVITVVSGLPRSGTSLMMQMLAAGGMPLLTDGVRGADEDNPQGYFEIEAVKRLHKDSAWLGDAVGKSIKVIGLLLPHLPNNYSYRVIFMDRDIREVLASQRSMLERRGETGADLSDEALRQQFTLQNQRVKGWLRSQPNVELLEIEHRKAISDPASCAAAVRAFLGDELDEDAMAEVVDPRLHRHQASDQ